MTLEEIEAAYPDQWVLIADPYPAQSSVVLGGRVIYSTLSQSDAWAEASRKRTQELAVLYIGAPPDVAYAL